MLAGRDAERAAIAALLDAARTGSGGALVVRGVAGSGKSTLLTDALGAAPDMTVLRTSGVESESPLAFAALQRLLWPLRGRLGVLPAPQRIALGAAMGEVEGEGDRFLAFLGTLSLLADAAEETPVLAVVDDAHWLDEASAAALLELVPEPLVLTEEEALTTFAANSVVVGRTVVMPACPPRVRAQLEDWGFEVVLVDVAEFHKGGGSIRCLTNPVDIALGRDLALVPGGEVVLP